MDRLPTELLYFVIYNPTLQPTGPVQPDDEDAEEQAHVLFYTAKNHAVSKDRVLRQVGLAKAMANFTTLFEPQSPCESVHSAGRRMLMVSPEQDFWFHACFELEKNARPPRKDSKSRSVKGKEKETVYDVNESSLHDKSLRTRLTMAYEAFKLTHGSFTTILQNVGREALEVQLERFFTVWAWNWDLNKVTPFTDFLGPRVHPLSNQLTHFLDTFEDRLPLHYYCIVLVGTCVVGSRGIPPECPVSVFRHFIHLLQARARLRDASVHDISSLGHGDAPSKGAQDARHSRVPSKSFLGVPMPTNAVNVTMNAMYVRKWSWPEALSFGIGGPSTDKINKSRSNEGSDSATISQPRKDDHEPASLSPPVLDTPIDTQSLADALSDSIHQSPKNRTIDEHNGGNSHPTAPALLSQPQPLADEAALFPVNLPSQEPQEVERLESVSIPPFSETYHHFDHESLLHTRRRLIRYLIKSDVLLAVIPSRSADGDELEDSVCKSLEEKGLVLLDRVKEVVDEEEQKIATAFASSPVQNVFSKSQHVISVDNDRTTQSSPNFSATSWHLHEGKQALDVDKHILEVYSRGQNPQDWHLSRRIGERAGGNDYVFMEIGRKEASLVDVESEVAGVLRRFSE